ncbi:MAG TPA: phosphoglucosamine mutase, partial [Cyanobacteria bacterium UBA11148]|nr:phosphoglucosamine mutase [Cyanobacteria bacterium UBA11148]
AVLDACTTNPPTEVAGIKVKEVGRKDGIKLYLEEGSWVLLRPSGTEPLMRVYMETNSPEKETQIATAMEQMINKMEPVAV